MIPKQLKRLPAPLESAFRNVTVSALDSIFGIQEGSYTPPTPTPMPDWFLQYTSDKTTVEVGETVHFTMTIDNVGTADATTVVIENIVPAEFNNIRNLTSTVGTPGLVGNTVTLNLATVTTAEADIVLEFDADGASAGNPKSIYTVDCAEKNFVTSPEVDFDIQIPLPEWAGTLAADPTSVVIGSATSVTLTFENIGAGPATTLLASIPVPTEFTNVVNLASSHGTPTLEGSFVKLALASVPAGQVTTVTFDMDGDSVGTPSIQATIECSEIVNYFTNIVNLTVTAVLEPAWDYALAITPTTLNVGDTTDFLLTIENTGTANATNVQLTIDIKAFLGNVTGLSASHGTTQVSVNTVINTIGTMPPGQISTLAFTAEALSADQQTLVGVVTCSQLAADNTNSIQITTNDVQASTRVLSSDIVGDANPGDTATYTAVISNVGTGALTNGVYEDEISDANLTLVNGSVTTSAGSITQEDTRVEVDLSGVLGAGQVVTITYQALINAGMSTPGTVSAQGTLTTTELGAENTNQVTDNVVAAVSHSATVVKSSNVVGNANPGDTVTYTVDLTKTGTGDIDAVVLADEISDADLTLVNGSATTDQGSITQDDTRVEINVGILGGTPVQITYQALINAGMTVPGTVSNQATLTSTQIASQNSNQVDVNVVAASLGPPPIYHMQANSGDTEIIDLVTGLAHVETAGFQKTLEQTGGKWVWNIPYAGTNQNATRTFDTPMGGSISVPGTGATLIFRGLSPEGPGSNAALLLVRLSTDVSVHQWTINANTYRSQCYAASYAECPGLDLTTGLRTVVMRMSYSDPSGDNVRQSVWVDQVSRPDNDPDYTRSPANVIGSVNGTYMLINAANGHNASYSDILVYNEIFDDATCASIADDLDNWLGL